MPPGDASPAGSPVSLTRSGVLRTRFEKSGRPGAALLLCGAVLIVPLLLIQNGQQAEASPSARSAATTHRAVDGRVRPTHVAATALAVGTSPETTAAWLIRSTEATAASAPPPGSAGQAPASDRTGGTTPGSDGQVQVTAPAEVVVDRQQVVQPTVAPPPSTTTTTTTAPPAPTPPSGPVIWGQVTYYGAAPGTCASPWLPFGTVVTVTNPANDESVTCVVNDREADTARAIDLATATFAEIAPLSQGVIDAEVSW
jgi:hypothetical protein